jgi:hypothetical protein
VVEAACRVGLALDNSVLPIQGPPGAGKTFTGARMICQLVNHGKKVGITAVSHKVIRKLLDEVLNAAGEMNGAEVSCAHRKEGADPDSRPVRELATNEEALQSLQSGAVNVLGGTPWLWCRERFRDSVHILFVDEAGQMSLANVLACAPAGKSLEATQNVLTEASKTLRNISVDLHQGIRCSGGERQDYWLSSDC